MKGFWKSATFLRWWTLLALERERQQHRHEGYRGLGLRGAPSGLQVRQPRLCCLSQS